MRPKPTSKRGPRHDHPNNQLNPNDHEKMQSRPRLRRLAWLPIPLLLLAMAGLRIAHLHASYGSASLIMALNLIFSMLASLLIVFLFSRSFLTRGEPGLLMLGCGVLTWGAAGVVTKAVTQGDANLDVTIHNLCVWLSALFHVGGALLLLRPRRAVQPRELWLGVAYAVPVGLLTLVALAALHGWTPVFFVQGAGGTTVRQLVLGSAIVMFLVTAGLLTAANRRPLSAFLYWYTLALGLIAVGLFGIMIESVFASLLSWMGLAAQYLSGVYMLIAAIASVRESGAWQISLEAALRESQTRLAAFAEATFEGIVESEAGWIVDCNEQLARMLGYSVAELKGLEIASLIAPEDRDRVTANIQESRESVVEHVMLRKDGTRIVVEVHGRPVSPGSARRHTAIRDITGRKRTEAALRESEARYRSLFNTIDAGFCIIEMIFDAQDTPMDYRFLEVNAAFEKQTGLHDAQGKRMRELAPAHEAHWFETYGKIAMTGEAEHFVNEARALGRWYDVYAYRVGAPESRQVAILFNYITSHKQADAELRRRAEELRAANEELTRFNRVTVGRELRIIELKKQVNELCARLGQPPRYAAELDEQVQPKP